MHLLTSIPTKLRDHQPGGGLELLTAIANEKRLALLRVLLQRELCVCELQSTFGWSQPLISHHLGVLRQVGLVQDRRDAQWVYYSVAPERLADLRQAFAFLLDPHDLPQTARSGANQRCCPAE
jgi:ArsR family transcriptional regulator, arsenate/arsenite/antimonite-responsive transcriptional repressor